MQPKLSHFQEIKQLISQKELVILVHAVNLRHNLQCINQDHQKCQFPANWDQAQQGVYRFNYIIPKGINKDKLVQFRMVDINEALSVNFVVENTQQLFNVQLPISNNEQNITKLEQQLSKILIQNKNIANENYEYRPIVDLSMPNNQRPPQMIRQPQPILGLGGRPLGSGGLFGGEEYVGPNSGLFGNQGGNLRIPSNGRLPPGARWDPTDPFGEGGNGNRNEFFGFNEWGQPQPKGGFGGNFGPNGNRFI